MKSVTIMTYSDDPSVKPEDADRADLRIVENVVLPNPRSHFTISTNFQKTYPDLDPVE